MSTPKLSLPTIAGNMANDVVTHINSLAEAVDGKAGVANGLAMTNAEGKVINADGSQAGEVTQAEFDGLKQKVTSHLADKANPHGVDKIQVGLGNVDNIKQIPMSEKGQPNGVAMLDADGNVINADGSGISRFELIATVEPSVLTSAIVLSSIPTKYKELKMLITSIIPGGSGGSLALVNLKINGDGIGTTRCANIMGSSVNGVSGSTLVLSSFYSQVNTTNQATFAEIEFSNEQGDAKRMKYNQYITGSTSTGQTYGVIGNLRSPVIEKITSIELSIPDVTYKFAPGTKIQLFGVL